MALQRSLLIFTLMVAIAPVIASATEHFVGGDEGWKTGVNYTEWAKDKQFVVGDSLVFVYKKGDHNVFKANQTEFQNCTVPRNNSLGYFSGNDTIPLLTSGMKWYICGKNGHCEGGQKLKINVLQSANASTPTPTPSPPSSSAPNLSISQIMLGALFAIVASMAN